MTFLQIINIIKETALAQPNVNTFVRQFLDLNREDTVYSAVVLQDRDGQRDRISEQDWNTYTFHLGYVDRLTFDESNRDDIFSTGINIINNIVASIRQTWFPDVEVNIIDRFTTFDQRFTASCAGVYVVLAIQVPVSDCVDSEQTDLYDKYEVTFDRNGHYHYIPQGRPIDEFDIIVSVEGGGGKPEETLRETITTNGSHRFDPTPGYVFSGADISVNVPTEAVLKKYKTEVNLDRHTSGFFLEPSDIQRLGADGLNEVELEFNYSLKNITTTISSNGSYRYEDPDDYYDYAEITVDVHPSESLSRSYTTNGSKTITGEFNGGTININVHPSTSYSDVFVSNGTYNIQGEFNGGVIEVSVPIKTEGSLSETILANGSYNYTPVQGSVYNSVALSVDVHPSQSLVQSISTNGSHTFTGEWTNASITVAVPIKTEGSLSETILSNGSYNYTPVQGSVYNSVALSVDVHPSQSLVQSISTNGSHTFTGEWTNAEITTDVHPSVSLVQSISTNGSHTFTGEWTNAEITVAVPTTTTVSMSQSAYDNLSVKDPNTIYLING